MYQLYVDKNKFFMNLDDLDAGNTKYIINNEVVELNPHYYISDNKEKLIKFGNKLKMEWINELKINIEKCNKNDIEKNIKRNVYEIWFNDELDVFYKKTKLKPNICIIEPSTYIRLVREEVSRNNQNEYLSKKDISLINSNQIYYKGMKIIKGYSGVTSKEFNFFALEEDTL